MNLHIIGAILGLANLILGIKSGNFAATMGWLVATMYMTMHAFQVKSKN